MNTHYVQKVVLMLLASITLSCILCGKKRRKQGVLYFNSVTLGEWADWRNVEVRRGELSVALILAHSVVGVWWMLWGLWWLPSCCWYFLWIGVESEEDFGSYSRFACHKRNSMVVVFDGGTYVWFLLNAKSCCMVNAVTFVVLMLIGHISEWVWFDAILLSCCRLSVVEQMCFCEQIRY